MTFDGLTIPDHVVRESWRHAIMRAAWLETFHVAEMIEFLYRSQGWPSYTAAMEGAYRFVGDGLRAGWIKPVAPEDGWYRAEGVGPIPVKRRKCV